MNTQVLWFTGLSGSGKSTLSKELERELRSRNKTICIIDGDQLRNTVHKDLAFSQNDIMENCKRITKMCYESLSQYDYIVVATISPLRNCRNYAREQLKSHFHEIYIKAGLKECIKRDVKGLYKQAISGKIKNFIGFSENTPYEKPLHPDLVIDTAKNNLTTSLNKLLKYLMI